MAESSGFFQSEWDEDLQNPITQEYTGYWDRSYVAREFADYFKLFIGNGVFNKPTNQLRVIPGEGLSVVVTPGWAFINGMWYHNDSNKQIVISENSTAQSRTDSIKVRYSDGLRTIVASGFTGETSVIQGDNIYDLKLANIVVNPLVTSISAANITDTRPDTTVCGFVRGILDIDGLPLATPSEITQIANRTF